MHHKGDILPFAVVVRAFPLIMRALTCSLLGRRSPMTFGFGIPIPSLPSGMPLGHGTFLISCCSFSLLTRVPFSQVKSKKIWVHDTSSLSEVVTWLSGIPEDILHQKLLCHHNRHKAGAQVSLPFSQLFISLFTPEKVGNNTG